MTVFRTSDIFHKAPKFLTQRCEYLILIFNRL